MHGSPRLRPLAFAIGAGLVGVLLDRFTFAQPAIPLFGPLLLLLSPVVSLVVGRRFGPAYGLVSVLVYGIHQTWVSGSPVLSLLLAGETLAVSIWTRHRTPALVADVLYWVVAGVPLATAGLRWLPGSVDGDPTLVVPVLLVLPVNGAICVLLANAVLWAPALGSRASDRTPPSFRSFLFDVLALALTIPVLILLVGFERLSSRAERQAAAMEMRDVAVGVGSGLDRFLDHHRDAIATLAGTLDLLPDDAARRQELLAVTHREYPGFLTMRIADEHGRVAGFSPAGNRDPDSFSITESSSFRGARDTRQSFVSEVFRGRGYGSDPVVWVSAPLLESGATFRGIVEGSLDLDRFEQFETPDDPSLAILVLDPRGRNVFATESLGLPQFEPVDVESTAGDGSTTRVVLRTADVRSFEGSRVRTDYGWTVLILRTPDALLVRSRSRLRWAFSLFLGSLPVIGLGAVTMSRRLTRPLERLQDEVGSLRLEPGELAKGESPDPSESFREVQDLLLEIRAAKSRLQEAHRQETQLLEQAVAAERRSEAKSTFLSTVSHELRTPLNAMIGIAQLMRSSGRYPKDDELLRSLSRAGDHLLDMIEKVLDLSRIEAGEQTLSLELRDLGPLVGECIEIVEQSFRDKRIGIEADIPETGGAWAIVDSSRVRQAVINLLSNAAKFTPEGGHVRVEVARRPAAGAVEIVVEDDGPGVPEEGRGRLFEPFERFVSPEAGIPGAGLGLAVSRRMVQAMGGAIELDESARSGARFVIRLPAALPSTVSREEKTSAVASSAPPVLRLSKPRTLLYVEDDPVSSLVTERFLGRTQDLTVLTATSVAEARERLERVRPDVVLTDLGLPDGTGREVLAATRALYQRLPVLVLTASALDRERRDSLEEGFDGYLTKPIRLDELAGILHGWLEGEGTPEQPEEPREARLRE